MTDRPISIDAHQHYWDPARGDYFWMVPGGKLDRVFAPADLRPSLRRNGIGGTVLVQAAPTLEETDYLLAIADREPTVLGVVGWIDFEDRSHLAALERFKRNPKFKGVRPMIQDIADPKWVKHPNLNWAFEALVDLDLRFDALLHPQHILPLMHRLLRHPGLRAVVDHAAKPRIGDAQFEPWSADIARLAGEDWPVCLRSCSYDRWFEAAASLTASLSDADCAAVFGGNAARFYGLRDPVPA